MKSKATLLFASLVIVSRSAFAGPDDVIGEWRGTSLCTNRQVAPACNDEQVKFIFSARGTSVRGMHVDAQKLVGAKYESMGEMDLVYSTENDAWTYVIDTPRAKAKWSFRVVKGELAGTLIDHATGLQIRKVSGVRWQK